MTPEQVKSLISAKGMSATFTLRTTSLSPGSSPWIEPVVTPVTYNISLVLLPINKNRDIVPDIPESNTKIFSAAIFDAVSLPDGPKPGDIITDSNGVNWVINTLTKLAPAGTNLLWRAVIST